MAGLLHEGKERHEAWHPPIPNGFGAGFVSVEERLRIARVCSVPP
jgi:hypothetical protein